jgi:uncharacterized protein with von Willebrand factor type A (vWA) domain
MFIDFFYLLRARGVPVSVTEWISFTEALYKGHMQSSLNHLYYVGRAFLVKSEVYYDQFDLAFQQYFGGIKTEEAEIDKFLEWLDNPVNKLPKLSFEEMEEMKRQLEELKQKYDLDELMRMFKERLKEQKERHDGGSKWIGTGGRSPFGAYGYHPGGIRVGGEGWMGSAVKVAEERRYKSYRNDLILDVRQTKVALKKLRDLKRDGLMEELDIDETIDKTAKEGGEIELVFSRSRENSIRLMLLMDIGGSMSPYATLCDRLFSAATQVEHFKDFQHFFFHNCIYQDVYTDMWSAKAVPTEKLFSNYHRGYKVIIVGDARMAYSELMDRYGSIEWGYYPEVAGRSAPQGGRNYPYTVWLTPRPRNTGATPRSRPSAVSFPCSS